ncbi:fibronectin type III domain-containing protein [Candidatus Kaiserbacteria bacterium]|nr:fibronectin type III domain-containing protein [Candidatus Kaiserbacteria bacterium]
MNHFRIVRSAGAFVTAITFIFAPISPALALGELPTDVTPPIISLGTVTSIATSSATITWTTNTNADTQVHYGTTSSYGSSSSLDSTLGLTHSVTLASLLPNMTYHYQIASRDASGNLTTSSDATFTTNSLPVVVISDTTPPLVSNIVAATVSSVAESIVWTTNEFATSTIRWSTDTSYSSTFLVSETAGPTHAGALVGLSPSTTYHYCIDATDLAGNTTSSCGHTFTTAEAPLIPDTIAPAIVDVASMSLEPHTATVTWTTDELAVSTLEYGTTMSYGTLATLSASALLSHAAELTGLTANTTYHYCLHATDLAGNITNSCGHSFTTAVVEVMLDTNPPTVSSVTVAPITTTSATIGWTTDEISGGYVEYGTTIGYGSETVFDTNLALTHEATLAGLTPDTIYHYRVHSRDEAGNTVITPDETFTTPQSASVTAGQAASIPIISTPSDTTPPSIREVTTSSIGSTITTINWTTNELAVSTFDYGTTQSLGSHAELSGSGLLTHDATLVGLSPSTTYYYCIHATDLAGNVADSCGHSFVTGAPPLVPDTTAPSATSVVVSSIIADSASIHWTSSETADSQVQYGTTINYGMETPIEAESNFSGTASLANLALNTTYHFRIRSYDSSGNVGLSSDYTFTTAASSGSSGTSANAAPIISGVGAGTIGETSATINWTTDVPADSLLEYGNSENLGSGASSATLTTSHAITLTGLSSDTNYQFRVISKPAGGAAFQTTSPMHEFTTLAVPIIVDPAANITSVLARVVGSDASVSFTTDEMTTGQIEYGLDTSYGSAVAWSEGREAGTLSIPGLQPGTYHFRVKAIDVGDNITYSEDHTFMIAGSSFATSTQAQTQTSDGSSSSVAAPASAVSSAALAGNGGGGSFALAVSTPVPNVVTAEGVDSQIVFAWRNPETSNFAGTVVLRKAGGYPSGPHDGTVIYNGSAQTFTDTSLTNGTTYYYSLYSYNSTNQYSNPIHVSTAPKAGVTEVKIDRNVVLENALPAEHFMENLKLGDQNLEVEHLQQVLNTVSLHQSRLTTGYFGPLTQAALKKFQATYNLPQTGVTDPATRTVLDSISQGWMVEGAPTDIALLQKDLKRGDSGDDVGNLQEFLAFEGSYDEAIISSYFGLLTHGGVKDFQTRYGVTPVSGIVGPKTRHTIQTVLGL